MSTEWWMIVIADAVLGLGMVCDVVYDLWWGRR